MAASSKLHSSKTSVPDSKEFWKARLAAPAEWRDDYFSVEDALLDLTEQHRVSGGVQILILMLLRKATYGAPRAKGAPWPEYAKGITIAFLAQKADCHAKYIEIALLDLIERHMIERHKDGRSWKYKLLPWNWSIAPEYVAPRPAAITMPEKPPARVIAAFTWIESRKPLTLAEAVTRVRYTHSDERVRVGIEHVDGELLISASLIVGEEKANDKECAHSLSQKSTLQTKDLHSEHSSEIPKSSSHVWRDMARARLLKLGESDPTKQDIQGAADKALDAILATPNPPATLEKMEQNVRVWLQAMAENWPGVKRKAFFWIVKNGDWLDVPTRPAAPQTKAEKTNAEALRIHAERQAKGRG